MNIWFVSVALVLAGCGSRAQEIQGPEPEPPGHTLYELPSPGPKKDPMSERVRSEEAAKWKAIDKIHEIEHAIKQHHETKGTPQ